MSGILFLHTDQRYSDIRRYVWENVEHQANVKLVTSCDDLKTAMATSSCVITHLKEYRSCEVDSLDVNVPVIVFTGGSHGRTISVDTDRPNTHLLPFDMLFAPDPLIADLFARVNKGDGIASIVDYINTMYSELLDIPRRLSACHYTQLQHPPVTC